MNRVTTAKNGVKRVTRTKRGSGLMRYCPVWIKARCTPGYERVWEELASLEDYGEEATVPSLAWISRNTGLSETTVKEAIKELEAIGAMRRIIRPGYTSCYHCFMDDPEWGLASQEEMALEVPTSSEEGVGRIPTHQGSRIPATNNRSNSLSSPDTKEQAGTSSRARVGVSVKELIGCFMTSWRQEFGEEYVISDKDRAVLADHLMDFESTRDAASAFRERIRWSRRDAFWKDKLCLRAALETIPNQMTLRSAEGGRSPDGLSSARSVASDLMSKFREASPEQFDREMAKYNYSGSSSSSVGTTESPEECGPVGVPNSAATS